MAIGDVKIWARGNYVYCLKEMDGGTVQKREFKSQTKVTQDEQGSDEFVIHSDDLGLGSKNISKIFKENGDPYTSEEFLLWADDNTGFNTAPGGSGAHSGLNLDDGTNPHGTTKADLGLSNVDNTSDSSKPVSTVQQAALDGKANTSHNHAIGDVTGLQGELDGKAPTTHGHAISDVSGLQGALDLKLEDVATDATIEGDGKPGTPLSVVKNWSITATMLGGFTANGVTAYNAPGAGHLYTFEANQDDELVGNIELDRNGLTYGGEDLVPNLHWQLFSSPAPGQNVKFEVDYLFASDGDDNYADVSGTVVVDVDVSSLNNREQITTQLPEISGAVGASTLQLTIRRNGLGVGSDSYGGDVDVYAFGLKVQ